jgi:hypothetical protein
MAKVDPQIFLDRMLVSHQSPEERNQVYSAMRELAAQDIDVALQYFEQVTSPQDKQVIGNFIAQELARTDPTRALTWARDNQSSEYFAHILGQIALSDPQLAIEEAKNIQHAERRREAISTISRTLTRSNPALAVEVASQLPNSRERDFTIALVFSGWIQSDADAALTWLTTNTEFDPANILDGVGMRMMMNDIDVAIRVLPHLEGQTSANWKRQIAQQLASQHSIEDAQSFIARYRGLQQTAGGTDNRPRRK